MNKNKLFMKVVLGILLATALASSAGADTMWYYQTGSVTSSPPGFTYFAFDITPFDSSLGTLNSVTMYAEVNVSGSAQLGTADEFATLSVNFSNTLDAVTEMGFGPTVASFVGSKGLDYYFDFYDPPEGYALLDGSGNNFALNTIFANFGRFAGPDPFQIGLQLSGLAFSNGSDIPTFSYDGNAILSYDYDYTPGAQAPVPVPPTVLLLGSGLFGIAAFRRKLKK